MGEAFIWLWDKYLYAPFFNALIWIYNGPAGQNLGAAVIILTVAFRILLLPLTVLSERNKHIYAKVEEEIKEIERVYKNDAEQQKDRIRELLRERRVSPWSRFASLALQALVLIVLYQVFMGGIKMNKFDFLYDSVIKPDIVFTNFLGWDLAERSLFWSGLVGIWLFLEISAEQRKHRESVTKADQFYRIAFPLFSVLALWLLPSVKSIFILTTMGFSFTIASMRKRIFRDKS